MLGGAIAALTMRQLFQPRSGSVIFLSAGTLIANYEIALFLFVATMAFIGWPGVSVAQQLRKAEGPPKVSPELWKKAHDAGTVRVIVNLHVPGWTSKKLNREGELEREKMVADVQAEVLRELAGPGIKSLHSSK